MINEKMTQALNGHLNAECYSSYLYLSMAAYFASIELNGFANWMRVQVQEEDTHLLKFYDHIIERGAKVTLLPIAAPPNAWKSPLDAFEATLAHEQGITAKINDLIYLARDEKDNATEIFLQWFVTEQIEEEDNDRTVLGQLKLIADSPQALYLLDKELAQRVFVPPSAAGGA